MTPAIPGLFSNAIEHLQPLKSQIHFISTTNLQLTYFHKQNFLTKNIASVSIESSEIIRTSNVSVLPILEKFETTITRIVCTAEGPNITKASGTDKVPPIVFRKCSKELRSSIARKFYKIEQTGVFPNFGKYQQFHQLSKKPALHF